MSATRISPLHTGSFFKQEKVEVRKQRTPLAKMSAKRKKEGRIYTKLRKQFLEDNPICQMRVQCEHARSTEVHHKKGRGKFYLDVTSWLASCFYCHKWENSHRNAAVELGLRERVRV